MRRGNGKGSVCKLSGKRHKPWIARTPAEYTVDGKPIRKPLGTFRTKKEAEAALDNYVIDPYSLDSVTLEEIYRRWSEVKFATVKDKTVEMYTNCYSHLAPVKDMDIQDITVDHLQDILVGLSDQSKSLQKQIRSLISQLYKYAEEREMVRKNLAPFLLITGKDKKEKEIFTAEEIEKLWQHEKAVPFVDSILILLYTGFRVGELLTLEKSHIDVKTWTINHGNKTEAGKHKIVVIPTRIRPLILKRMQHDDKLLFVKDGKKIRYEYYLNSIFKPIIKNLGLNPKLTPHSCRHNYSTLLNKNVKNKVTISKLLGHTDYNLTANVYTHTDIEDLIEAVQDVDY